MEKHNTPIILLVTVCTKDRKPILCRDDVFPLLQEAWRDANSWIVGRFVIMPDHIHLFCSPAEFPVRGVGQWIRYWKSRVAVRWPYQAEDPIWQENFWDRQLRHGEHYGERWEYVRQNPVRAGLVANVEDWTWQGEMNVLAW